VSPALSSPAASVHVTPRLLVTLTRCPVAGRTCAAHVDPSSTARVPMLVAPGGSGAGTNSADAAGAKHRPSSRSARGKLPLKRLAGPVRGLARVVMTLLSALC